MSKLVDLLQKMGADAELAKDYEENPETVMKEAGLSVDEMEALKSGDLERIKKVTGLKELKRIHNIIRSYDE